MIILSYIYYKLIIKHQNYFLSNLLLYYSYHLLSLSLLSYSTHSHLIHMTFYLVLSIAPIMIYSPSISFALDYYYLIYSHYLNYSYLFFLYIIYTHFHYFITYQFSSIHQAILIFSLPGQLLQISHY